MREFELRIEDEARTEGVDADIIKAIMFVENARFDKFTLNRLAEKGDKILDTLGIEHERIASTLYPMNINPDLWGYLVPLDPNLRTRRGNIRGAVRLVKLLEQRTNNPTLEAIFTRYNRTNATSVTNYGAFAARVYREKPWQK